MGALITGTGIGLPSRVVTNEELESNMAMPPGAILRRTGITSRRWVLEHEATSDLAATAARGALQAAGRSLSDIDLMLVATTSGDMGFASTACLLQRELKVTGCPGFDLAASCTGFLYGLSIAQAFLHTGQATSVLLAATEVKSRFIDQRDPASAILFGDGAGAVILTAGPADRGVLDVALHADGSRWPLIHLPAGGSREPLSESSLAANRHAMQLDGSAVFRTAVRTIEQAVRDQAARFDLSLDQIDHFIFHQANLRILKQVQRRLGLPEDKVPVTISRYGNTSSSALPIALHHAVTDGRIKSGDWVLLAAFGGGITWGTALIRWP
ncbi:MAG: 3-oxoacyl-ACP synthase III family protein [Nitrospirota bacterium]